MLRRGLDRWNDEFVSMGNRLRGSEQLGRGDLNFFSFFFLEANPTKHSCRRAEPTFQGRWVPPPRDRGIVQELICRPMAAIGPSVPSLSVIQSGNGDAIKEKEGEGRGRRGIRRGGRERNYSRLPGHGAERARFRAFFVRGQSHPSGRMRQWRATRKDLTATMARDLRKSRAWGYFSPERRRERSCVSAACNGCYKRCCKFMEDRT